MNVYRDFTFSDVRIVEKVIWWDEKIYDEFFTDMFVLRPKRDFVTMSVYRLSKGSTLQPERVVLVRFLFKKTFLNIFGHISESFSFLCFCSIIIN